MSDLVRISLSIEKQLFDKLQRLIEQSGYKNRSEYVRDLVRDQLVQEEWRQDGEVVGTITLIYNHHVRELSGKLTHLQHDFHSAILASTHVHLDKHMCAETILVKGRAELIRKLADGLRQQKGVFHAAVSVSATGAEFE